MEILHKRPPVRIHSVLFDFDGTISTLRCNWEAVMKPLMAETLLACPGAQPEDSIKRQVDAYIDESTGIQTILQMKWLAQQVTLRGGDAKDPWAYKETYNRRLMLLINEKKRRLAAGKEQPGEYLVAGATAFLSALKARGVHMYVASGTDHPDVVTEATALGVFPLFDEVYGAPAHEENCSKEAVLKRLVQAHGLRGGQLAVIGDGKVEIRLGHEAGALTIGLASDEKARRGVNPVKRARLIQAGADVITGDFLEKDALLALMGLA